MHFAAVPSYMHYECFMSHSDVNRCSMTDFRGGLPLLWAQPAPTHVLKLMFGAGALAGILFRQ